MTFQWFYWTCLKFEFDIYKFVALKKILEIEHKKMKQKGLPNSLVWSKQHFIQNQIPKLLRKRNVLPLHLNEISDYYHINNNLEGI